MCSSDLALIVMLAQAGSYVPAREARIGITDRIFTRIGASDELHAGRSTFMVEMTETANILHHATDRSLVVLDEIGRGTSTLDGLSLAWAITEALASRGSRTLFATHYHELTSIADRMAAVTNLHVTVREWQDRIVFLHRIQAGRTDRSYGIHVAEIAGLAPEVVARARELLATLEVHEGDAAPPPAGDPKGAGSVLPGGLGIQGRFAIGGHGRSTRPDGTRRAGPHRSPASPGAPPMCAAPGRRMSPVGIRSSVA